MVWSFFGTDHEMAISSWVKAWLRGPFSDRFFLLVFGPWGSGWTLTFGLIGLASSAGFWLWIALAPWLFLIVDSIIDGRRVRADLTRLEEDGAVLSSRVEYCGGHPELPHGRFVYLTIDGNSDNPNITILLPGRTPEEHTRFSMPLLDFDSAEQTSQKTDSITASLLASISEKPGKLFADDRAVLNIKFTDQGGRKQNVELTNFFRGSSELRSWRNYLICAQAEADTGIRPYGPWKSLPPAPDAQSDTRNGGHEEPAGSSNREEDLNLNGAHRNGSGPGAEHSRAGGGAFRRR
jgi:hypothetical protein